MPFSFGYARVAEGEAEQTGNFISDSKRWTIEDGDTIINNQTGEVLRLAGMDTPETEHPEKQWYRSEIGAAEASRRTLDFINNAERDGQELQIERGGKDVYGRTLARVKGHVYDMISSGHAQPESRRPDSEADAALLDRMISTVDSPTTSMVDPEEQQAAFDRTRASVIGKELERPAERITGGVFGRGVARGADQAVASLGAATQAAGQALGIESLERAGESIVGEREHNLRINPPDVSSYTDIDSLGSGATYVVEKIAEQLPMFGTMALGGVVGATAKGAGALFNLGRAITLRQSAAAGAIAANYGLSAGEVQQELNEAGIRAGGAALIGGIPFAALDVVGIGFALKGLAKDVPLNLSVNVFRQIAKAAAKHGVLSTGVEATTETAQELVALTTHKLVDPTFEVWTPENIQRLKEAGVAGGVVGGVFGGAGRAARGTFDWATAPRAPGTGTQQPGGTVGQPPTSSGGTVGQPPTSPGEAVGQPPSGALSPEDAASLFEGVNTNTPGVTPPGRPPSGGVVPDSELVGVNLGSAPPTQIVTPTSEVQGSDQQPSGPVGPVQTPPAGVDGLGGQPGSVPSQSPSRGTRSDREPASQGPAAPVAERSEQPEPAWKQELKALWKRIHPISDGLEQEVASRRGGKVDMSLSASLPALVQRYEEFVQKHRGPNSVKYASTGELLLHNPDDLQDVPQTALNSPEIQSVVDAAMPAMNIPERPADMTVMDHDAIVAEEARKVINVDPDAAVFRAMTKAAAAGMLGTGEGQISAKALKALVLKRYSSVFQSAYEAARSRWLGPDATDPDAEALFDQAKSVRERLFKLDPRTESSAYYAEQTRLREQLAEAMTAQWLTREAENDPNYDEANAQRATGTDGRPPVQASRTPEAPRQPPTLRVVPPPAQRQPAATPEPPRSQPAATPEPPRSQPGRPTLKLKDVKQRAKERSAKLADAISGMQAAANDAVGVKAKMEAIVDHFKKVGFSRGTIEGEVFDMLGATSWPQLIGSILPHASARLRRAVTKLRSEAGAKAEESEDARFEALDEDEQDIQLATEAYLDEQRDLLYDEVPDDFTEFEGFQTQMTKDSVRRIYHIGAPSQTSMHLIDEDQFAFSRDSTGKFVPNGRAKPKDLGWQAVERNEDGSPIIPEGWNEPGQDRRLKVLREQEAAERNLGAQQELSQLDRLAKHLRQLYAARARLRKLRADPNSDVQERAQLVDQVDRLWGELVGRVVSEDPAVAKLANDATTKMLLRKIGEAGIDNFAGLEAMGKWVVARQKALREELSTPIDPKDSRYQLVRIEVRGEAREVIEETMLSLRDARGASNPTIMAQAAKVMADGKQKKYSKDKKGKEHGKKNETLTFKLKDKEVTLSTIELEKLGRTIRQSRGIAHTEGLARHFSDFLLGIEFFVQELGFTNPYAVDSRALAKQWVGRGKDPAEFKKLRRSMLTGMAIPGDTIIMRTDKGAEIKWYQVLDRARQDVADVEAEYIAAEREVENIEEQLIALARQQAAGRSPARSVPTGASVPEDTALRRQLAEAREKLDRAEYRLRRSLQWEAQGEEYTQQLIEAGKIDPETGDYIEGGAGIDPETGEYVEDWADTKTNEGGETNRMAAEAQRRLDNMVQSMETNFQGLARVERLPTRPKDQTSGVVKRPQVESDGTEGGTWLANVATKLLKAMGLKIHLEILTSADAIQRRINALRGQAEDLKTLIRAAIPGEDKDLLIREFNQVVGEGTALARMLSTPGDIAKVIYRDNYLDLQKRRPLIVIRIQDFKKMSRIALIEMLTHELGHVIYVAHFKGMIEAAKRLGPDSAPAKMILAMEERFDASVGSEQFSERFAQELYYWALHNTSAKEAILSVTDGVRVVGKALRRLWQEARKQFGVTSQTFGNYIRELVHVHGDKDRVGAVTELGKIIEKLGNPLYLQLGAAEGVVTENFTVSPARVRTLVADAKTGAKKVQYLWRQSGAMMAYSVDAQLRQILRGAGTLEKDIADHFKHRAGSESNVVTVEHEIMSRSAPYLQELQRITEKLPSTGRWIFKRVDEASTAYRNVSRALVKQLSLQDMQQANMTREEIEVVRDIRRVLTKVYAEITRDLGLNVGFLANYFPLQIDLEKVRARYDDVVAILERHGYSRVEAEKHVREILETDGLLVDLGGASRMGLFAPSFRAARSRAWTIDIVRDLEAFYVDDPIGVTVNYINSAIKRGVIDKRFGAERPTGRSQNVRDPFGKIHEMMARAVAQRQLTKGQARRVYELLEAYMGRVGADPRWDAVKKVGAYAVLYQNIRLLPLAVLSSFGDTGMLMIRGGFKAYFEGLKFYMEQANRDQLNSMVRMIGAVRDDLTLSLTNDQVSLSYLSPKARRFNELFFRANFMHGWTTMQRSLGLAVARAFLKEHATNVQNRGPDWQTSQHYLKELGLTAGEAMQWVTDPSAALRTNYITMSSALHRFLDQSVLRPTAGNRPRWASDPRLAPFWHLKNYMWTFSDEVLRRMISEARRNPQLGKQLMALGAMPFVLGIALLPLAATGYEIRRFVTGMDRTGRMSPYDPDSLGSYIWEVSQRAGMLGAFQWFVDAERAEGMGKLSLLSGLGPTADQFQDFIAQDFGKFTLRAIPLLSQSRDFRNLFQD